VTATPSAAPATSANTSANTNSQTGTTTTTTTGAVGTSTPPSTGTSTNATAGLVPGNSGYAPVAQTDANGNPILGFDASGNPVYPMPNANVSGQAQASTAPQSTTTIISTPLLDQATKNASAREQRRKAQRKEPTIIGIAPRTNADKTDQMPDDKVIRY
jgi:hypothetical protein